MKIKDTEPRYHVIEIETGEVVVDTQYREEAVEEMRELEELVKDCCDFLEDFGID